MAGTSENVTVRMKKNVLSWFGHVEHFEDTSEGMYEDVDDSRRGERGMQRCSVWQSVLSGYLARDTLAYSIVRYYICYNVMCT